MPERNVPLPPWTDVPFALLEASRSERWRVTSFRLTEGERDQLMAVTGQKAMLLGFPVKDAWRDDAAAHALKEACQ